jgi:NHLM bacteriocin system ABC transporter ATP-binding protein
MGGVVQTGLDQLRRFAEDGGTGPCPMTGRRAAYLVDGGEADLFAVRRRLDGAPSRRHFVARLPAGAVLPSSAAVGAWQLLAVPLPGSTLRGVTDTRLRLLERAAAATGARAGAVAAAAGLAAGLDQALVLLADAVRAGQGPRDAAAVHPDELVSLAAGGALTSTGAVCWLRTTGGPLSRNGGGGEQEFGHGELVPVAGRDWVVAAQMCTVESVGTADLLAAGTLWDTVDAHMARLLRLVELRVDADDAAYVRAVRERRAVDAAVVARSARRSLGVLGVRAAERAARAAAPHETDPLERVAGILGALLERTEVTVTVPADRAQAGAGDRDALRAVARASALHLRDVQLPERWWRADHGPLVGWEADAEPAPERGLRLAALGAPPEPAGTATALVFRRGRYHRLDPETRAATPLDARAAARFGTAATQVQVPLPRRHGLRRLVRHGLLGAGRDVRGLLLAGLAVAALGQAAPLVSGHVLGRLATAEGTGGLAAVSALFVVSGLVAALVGVTQNLRLLRLEGRLETGTQLAVWDHVMRLPVRYFSRTTSGELANKVLGIELTREIVSSLLAQAVYALLTVVVVIGFLLWVNAAAAALAGAVALAAGLLTAVFGRLLVRRQRAALPAEHRAAAVTNELLSGITKLKLAAAEDRGYGRWAEAEAAAREKLQRVRLLQAVLLAVAGTLPIAAELLLFGVLVGPLDGRIGPAEFFVLNTSFLGLVGALVVLVATAAEMLATLPRLEGLRDVLDAPVEQHADRVDPGDLRGEIELAHVTFGYQPDEPPVLDDVSLRVRSGEFVAIVGPSGCGKSTLLRLLLGFERPGSGSVRYDGQDLSDLDVRAVRRQCGVVLQDGTLFAGTLRENICGAGRYSLDQLWDAARMAGIAEDIRKLPMRMSTMVPYKGGTLSVGQRQRVLIARALVAHPRVLFFDEATSALDNRTQEIIADSTRQLAATRVVIAHRLSTVVDADTIVVLDRGRVVQQGTYAELMADEDGLFHRLARRQLLEVPAGGED